MGLVPAAELGEMGAPAGRAPLPVSEIRNLGDLADRLKAARDAEREAVAGAIRELLGAELKTELDSKFAGLEVLSVSHEGLVGQVVRDRERILYVSLVATGGASKRADWKRAGKFRI